MVERRHQSDPARHKARDIFLRPRARFARAAAPRREFVMPVILQRFKLLLSLPVSLSGAGQFRLNAVCSISSSSGSLASSDSGQ